MLNYLWELYKNEALKNLDLRKAFHATLEQYNDGIHPVDELTLAQIVYGDI